jgi:LuxR family maltose regulon positive regulatory protein
VHDKSTPSPPAPGPLIVRSRLLLRLTEASAARCVELRGPAGSGKTSLLLAWRRDLLASGADVAWLALSAEDDEPTRFFDALIAALQALDARLVAEASALAGRGSGEEIMESLVIALLRAMARHPRELVLVLDDVHHVHNPCLWRALQMLLDHGPARLRLVVATRAVLPLALARLRAQQQLLELGMEDLRFTLEESAQLATRVLGQADEALARELHARSDGWAAGLKLLCLDLRGEHRGEPVRDARTFAEFFGREVMDTLPPEALAFLLRSALPEQFNVELCAALLAPAPDLAACERMLRALQEQGLFILPAGPRYPEGWWRLHPLLRDALLERLRAESPTELRRLHELAWHFHAQRHMVYEAVRHALLAGAEEAAGALVESCGTDLFVRGELRRLVSLVKLLPPAMVERRTGLRLWLAWAELYERRLDACARSIARLRHELVRAEPAQRFRLTLLRVLHAVQSDDSRAAVAVLPELLDAPAEADAVALTGRRSMLTWIHLYRGDYDSARRVQLDDEVPLFEGQPVHGTPIGLLGGRCLLGLSYAVQGQVLQAERIYRDVLFEAERRGPSCADPGALGAALLAESLYELNDPQGVLDLLEPRLEVMERVSFPDSRLRMTLHLARARWLLGRPLDALDYLGQTIDDAERAGQDRLHAYLLLEQLQFRLRQGDLERADQLLAPLEALGARHADAESGTLAEIGVVVERARIRLWSHTGDADRALRHLEALTELCRQRGRARRVPDLQLQSAVALRMLGRHAEAREKVRQALRLGNQLGLLRTLLDAHADVPELVRDTLLDEALDPVLRFYAERLEAAVSSLEMGVLHEEAAALPGLEALSPREAEIVDLLLRSLPNKRIARALDLSLDTVKWHLKNIYGKLGVSGRDEVLARLGR